METSQRVNQVRALRAQLGVKHRLRLELHSAISRLLREHGIDVEDEVLRYLTFADEEEFGLLTTNVATPAPVPGLASAPAPGSDT